MPAAVFFSSTFASLFAALSVEPDAALAAVLPVDSVGFASSVGFTGLVGFAGPVDFVDPAAFGFFVPASAGFVVFAGTFRLAALGAASAFSVSATISSEEESAAVPFPAFPLIGASATSPSRIVCLPQIRTENRFPLFLDLL